MTALRAAFVRAVALSVADIDSHVPGTVQGMKGEIGRQGNRQGRQYRKSRALDQDHHLSTPTA